MEPTTKRRPIRGLLYGLVLGIGLTLIVVGQGIAALGTWPPFLVLVGGTVFGVLWSTMGPAKAPKGPAPVAAELVEDHARLRAAAGSVSRVSVEAVLPPDVIGLFVLMPGEA